MKRLIIASSLTLLAAVAHAATTDWTYDAAHSSVGFTVPHMGISSVDGRFKQATATVALDEADLTKSSVALTIAAASIDTDNADRDKHLRSPDFFDVEKYPNLTFKSTKITKAGGNKYKLTGDLTIKNVTKPVTLDATISAPAKNPWGKQVRGVTATGSINRKEYGLTWSKVLETGGLLVGDVVTINVKAELNK